MLNAAGEPHPNGYCKHMVRLDHRCGECLTELASAEAADRRSRIDGANTREELEGLVNDLYPNGLPGDK